jgi:hypothetical protein
VTIIDGGVKFYFLHVKEFVIKSTFGKIFLEQFGFSKKATGYDTNLKSAKYFYPRRGQGLLLIKILHRRKTEQLVFAEQIVVSHIT